MSATMINITPALASQEWERLAELREAHLSDSTIVSTAPDGQITIQQYRVAFDVSRAALPGLIAIANAALHDDDPRKITRDRIVAMREALDETDNEALRQFADALEAYLPPTH